MRRFVPLVILAVPFLDTSFVIAKSSRSLSALSCSRQSIRLSSHVTNPFR